GNIVSQANYPRGLDAGSRFKLVKGDDRAGTDVEDLALDAEIFQNTFEQAGVLFQHLSREAWIFAGSLGLCQQIDRRQVKLTVDHDALGLALDSSARLWTRRGIFHTCGKLGSRRLRRLPAGGGSTALHRLHHDIIE